MMNRGEKHPCHLEFKILSTIVSVSCILRKDKEGFRYRVQGLWNNNFLIEFTRGDLQNFHRKKLLRDFKRIMAILRTLQEITAKY